MTASPNLITGITFAGVGPDGSSDTWLFADEPLPSDVSLSGFTVRDDAIEFSGDLDRSEPTRPQFDTASWLVQLHASDDVAELVGQDDRRAVAEISEDLEPGQTGTVSAEPPSSTGFFYIGGETIHVDSVGGSSIDVAARGQRRSVDDRHTSGTLLYDDPPYWRARVCEVLTWSRSMGLEAHWPGIVESVDREGTSIRVKARGLWSAAADVEIKDVREISDAEGEQVVDYTGKKAQLITKNVRVSEPGQSAVKRPTSSFGDTDRRRLYIDEGGKLLSTFSGRGVDGFPFAILIDPIQHSRRAFAYREDQLPVDLAEIGVVGPVLGEQLAETIDLMAGTDFENHAAGAVLAIFRALSEDLPVEQDYDQRSALDVMTPYVGLESGVQVLGDAAESNLREAATTDYPNATVDHWLVGHQSESVMDAIRRAITPVGLSLGVDASGQLDLYRPRLPGIGDVYDTGSTEVHWPDGGLPIRTRPAEDTVEEVAVTIGLDTDEDDYVSDLVLGRREQVFAARRELGADGEQLEIDGSALKATEGRRRQVGSQVRQRLIAFRQDRIEVVVPFDAPRMGLGDAIEITDLGEDEAELIRKGTRGPTVDDDSIVGTVVGRGLDPQVGGWRLELIWRSSPIMHRAPAAHLTSKQTSDQTDDTARAVSGAQWGNDVAADGALFNPGDEVSIWDRTFSKLEDGLVVKRVDDVSGEPRDIVMESAISRASLDDRILRLDDYDVYDDDSSRYGTDNPWTWQAESDLTLGADDDLALDWG